jgi:hypothetical protein
MTTTNQDNHEALLKEILPLPSDKIITDRFSASNESQEGPCSGRCKSGSCMGFV